MNPVKLNISFIKPKQVLYLLLTLGVPIATVSCKKEIASHSQPNRFANSSILFVKNNSSDTAGYYKIVIKGNGEAAISGGMNSIKQGNYKTIIPAKVINKLFNELECSNFSDFHSEYGTSTLGTVPNEIRFVHRGYEKWIRMYSDIPEELLNIISFIEGIAEDEKGSYHWQKDNKIPINR